MVALNDPRIELCGYARLLGESLDYTVKKCETILGRVSKNPGQNDVTLGDNMNISRQHAKITWDPASKTFVLVVMGKNGVSVNNALYTPSSEPLSLKNSDLLSVGDKTFYFLLPKPQASITKRDLEALSAVAAVPAAKRPRPAPPQVAPSIAPMIAPVAAAQAQPRVSAAFNAQPASLRQHGVLQHPLTHAPAHPPVTTGMPGIPVITQQPISNGAMVAPVPVQQGPPQPVVQQGGPQTVQPLE